MSKVNTATVVGDATSFAFQAPAREAAPPVERPAPEVTDQSDFRLIIEEDEATGSFIYKTLDRRTGEIIQQFPRDEVLKLKQGEFYSAGALISTRA